MTPPEGDSTIRRGLRLAAYAKAKQLPEDFLRGLGLGDIVIASTHAVKTPYYDSAGVEVATRFRFALDGEGRLKWKKGTKACLYGLGRLAEGRAADCLVLVEGESDAQTCWLHGIPALGLPGAASWQEAWAEHLDGIGRILVVIEPDHGGDSLLKRLQGSCVRDRAWAVRLQTKDVNDLHVADPEAFDAAWAAAVEQAVPFVQLAAETDARGAADAFAVAAPLLDDPAVLDRVADVMRVGGYAGDPQPALIAYVACTSRLLARPINLVFVAPSAAGKNRALDAALAIIPPEAVYEMSAGSARALIYTEADFAHRIVVVKEADSLPEEGPAASAVRAIAADNVMSYDVVERDERTGRHRTRRVEKPGPTGLLTTSTRSLRAQLGTRHLEVAIRDDPGQTRAVMRVQAAQCAGTVEPPSDLAALIAVQRWLQLAGARLVVVPFAPELAELVPCDEVRMRRDFLQLLTAIQAVALLRQRQRARTPEGAVVAMIDDYSVVRRLFGSVFDTIAAGGVTPAVRQTVEVVTSDAAVTRADLVARLGLSPSTVRWRVSKALKQGWLVEEKCDRTLRRGTPLPTETTALPDPTLLAARVESSNGSGGGETPHSHAGGGFESSNGSAGEGRSSPGEESVADGEGDGST